MKPCISSSDQRVTMLIACFKTLRQNRASGTLSCSSVSLNLPPLMVSFKRLLITGCDYRCVLPCIWPAAFFSYFVCLFSFDTTITFHSLCNGPWMMHLLLTWESMWVVDETCSWIVRDWVTYSDASCKPSCPHIYIGVITLLPLTPN